MEETSNSFWQRFIEWRKDVCYAEGLTSISAGLSVIGWVIYIAMQVTVIAHYTTSARASASGHFIDSLVFEAILASIFIATVATVAMAIKVMIVEERGDLDDVIANSLLGLFCLIAFPFGLLLLMVYITLYMRGDDEEFSFPANLRDVCIALLLPPVHLIPRIIDWRLMVAEEAEMSAFWKRLKHENVSISGGDAPAESHIRPA